MQCSSEALVVTADQIFKDSYFIQTIHTNTPKAIPNATALPRHCKNTVIMFHYKNVYFVAFQSQNPNTHHCDCMRIWTLDTFPHSD